MNEHWKGVAWVAVVLISAGCIVQPAPPPQPVADVPPGPEVAVPSYPALPPPQTEVIIVQPSPAHVWVAGHWTWHRGRRAYVWAPGHWVVPPGPRRVWVPGHWATRPGGYVWVEGHWR
jgi:YXWGXW repeat-containing protein